MSDEQKPWGPRERQRFVEKVLGPNSSVEPVDLMPEDLPALLSCETRMVQNPAEPGWLSAWWEQQVFYSGKWLKVGVTDLFDDVRTVRCSCGAPENQTQTVANLVPIAYGARLGAETISFITHMTDG